MMKSGNAPNMYAMMCGRVTPAYRGVIRRRCLINAENIQVCFKMVNW